MDKYRETKDRYLKEKVDEIKIRVPIGSKEVIKSIAKKQGKSVNKFIVDLINDEISKYNK